MGETATNLATLDMKDAIKIGVTDGCTQEDPCSSSPCPEHSRCHDTWDSYACVCDRGGSGSPAALGSVGDRVSHAWVPCGLG